MVGWSITLFVVSVGVAAAQAVYVFLFSRSMLADDSIHRATSSNIVDNRYLPPAAVILCVRGCDPTLEKCLYAVANQDYPDFEIHIVLDHTEDPAAKMIQHFASKYQNVVVHILTRPNDTCGLKCSSLTQAIHTLSPEIEIVAMLDVDSIPRQRWLRQIAHELQDSDVGVVSGIRCFVPEDCRIGTLVRYQWNSAASVQMYLYKIPWGGTLGFRQSTLAETRLPETWNRTFCEDTILAKVMHDHGKRVVISPALCIPNSESCRLGSFIPWVTRQLLTAKLYHSKWPLVVGHALITSVSFLALVVTLIISMLTSNFTATAWLASGVLTFLVANWIMLCFNQRAVAHQLNQAMQASYSMNLTEKAIQILLLPVTQAVYLFAVLKTTALNQVSWRQVNYDIKGPFKIRRLNHDPYVPRNSQKDSL